MSKLKLVFGPIIRWLLLIYTIAIKTKETEKLEKYLESIANKRNSITQAIEEKKQILVKINDKINTNRKSHDPIPQTISLVFFKS